MSYWADEIELGRRVASYVDRILKGAHPGDLPIEQPTKYDLVVNLKTAKRFGDPLVPDSVLKDSMSNLQRLVDFSSPASVKAMIDSALDGGVPLLVHQPGTFGKDSFQVTLRAKADTPQFQEVVNDGVEMEHTAQGSKKVTDGQGRGTGWGLGIKAPGLAAPGSANPNVSGTAGVAAAANIGQSKSSSVTNSTVDQFSQFRGASGPAARYAVPVEFELVIEKGDKVVAKADSGPQEMVVRLHADNQKVVSDAEPSAYQADQTPQPAAAGTPHAVFALTPADLCRLTGGQVVDLKQQPGGLDACG